MTTCSARRNDAIAQGNARRRARLSCGRRSASTRNDPAVWLKLANVSASPPTTRTVDANGTRRLRPCQRHHLCRAQRLPALGQHRRRAPPPSPPSPRGLEGRQMWREAIATYRAVHRAGRRSAPRRRGSTRSSAEHGFRVTSHDVDAEAAQPRICATFSDPLPAGRCRPGELCLGCRQSAPRGRGERQPDLPRRRRARRALSHHPARRPALRDRREAAEQCRSRHLCARPLALCRLRQHRLCHAGRPRRRPADHLGQRQERRHRHLPDRRPRHRRRRARRRLQADARRLFGRGHRPEDRPARIRGHGRPDRDQAQRNGRHRHSRRRRAQERSSRAPMSSPPRSPTASRNTGSRWRRNGSSSPISA